MVSTSGINNLIMYNGYECLCCGSFRRAPLALSKHIIMVGVGVKTLKYQAAKRRVFFFSIPPLLACVPARVLYYNQIKRLCARRARWGFR